MKLGTTQKKKRKDSGKAFRKTTYIFTNGETEEDYFKALRTHCNLPKNEAILVKFLPKDNSEPEERIEIKSLSYSRLSLVKKVKEIITGKEKSAVGKVFIVFDADTEPKGKSSNPSKLKSQVNDAWAAAKSAGFIPILSNESFELWYLLHFEDVPLKSKIHRDILLQEVKKHIPNYNKGKAGYFGLTFPDLKTAIKRAKKMAEQYNAHTPPADKNPYTNVYELVEELAKRAGKEYIDLD